MRPKVEDFFQDSAKSIQSPSKLGATEVIIDMPLLDAGVILLRKGRCLDETILNYCNLPENRIDEIMSDKQEFKKLLTSLQNCVNTHQELENLIIKAHTAYNDDEHTRSDQRARAVCKTLGLTDGKRPDMHDKDKMWFRYLTLLLDRNISQQDAVREVTKEFNVNSYNACIEMMRRYAKEKNNDIKGYLPSKEID